MHSTYMATNSRNYGASGGDNERAQRPKTVLFKPSEWKEIETQLDEWNKKLPQEIVLGTLMHDITLAAVRGEIPITGIQATVQNAPNPENVANGFIATAPAGPWKDAVLQADHFEISSDTQKFLQVSTDDMWIRVSGDSMRGAGIVDGMLALLTPLPRHGKPRKGEIALVQIVRDNGEAWESTVKRWVRDLPDGTAQLQDGNDEDFALPVGTEQVIPIGTISAVMGRVG